MATIGQVAVNLTARSQAFVQGVQHAGTSLRGFGGQLNTFKNKLFTVQNALGAFAASAVVSKVTNMVTTQLDYADSLANTADKLGATTEGLAALRFAGEQTGVSVQTMDMALQRMSRRVAEAAKGTGEAKQALINLGLEAVKLDKLTLFEKFVAIAEAMEQVESPTERLKEAFKLFDSEGVALVNTLALGRTGLIEMKNQASDLGILLDRDTAGKAQAANSALNELHKSVTAIALTMATELAPIIESISNQLTSLVQGFKAATAFGKGFLEGVFMPFSKLDRGGDEQVNPFVSDEGALRAGRATAAGSPRRPGGGPRGSFIGGGVGAIAHGTDLVNETREQTKEISALRRDWRVGAREVRVVQF